MVWTAYSYLVDKNVFLSLPYYYATFLICLEKRRTLHKKLLTFNIKLFCHYRALLRLPLLTVIQVGEAICLAKGPCSFFKKKF